MNRYKITLLVTIMAITIMGCAKQKHVPVYEHFWAIDSFSPNGDGLNDEFLLKPNYYIQLGQFHITIYNENLQLMFESNDILKGWDGNYAVDKPAPAGFYDYQIVYTASTDSVHYDDYVTSSKVNLFR